MSTTNRVENLGPAERIIQTLITYSDHAVHNRPGVVVSDTSSPTGVRWEPATFREEGEGEAKQKIVYKLTKVGKKTDRVRVGVLQENMEVLEGSRKVASYRKPGVFPEVVFWMWEQISKVYELDNEFAARWASHAFGEEHRDLKALLAAFMMVQSRKGDPIKENGKVLFRDEDFRNVGEAMCLIRRSDGKDINPKLLLRIRDFLSVPQVAEFNRARGFGVSAKRAHLGRWPKAVTRWLEHREQNPGMLKGLVKAGYRTTVMELVRAVGYKPMSSEFFSTLRWKQKQGSDGRRQLAIGVEVSKAEDWKGLTEVQICERICQTKPNWKRIVGLLPSEVGVTRAIVAASIESGSLSDQDLIILTPTLEDLGLLKTEPVKSRWENALKKAENQRASNILTRVKSQETVEKLQEASDNAVKKALAEVTKGLVVYFFLDISGSMSQSLAQGKKYIAQFLQGIPLDKLHVATFNTIGRVVNIRHASSAGVDSAFAGINAGGGTDYGAGVKALAQFRPKEDEDAVFFFVGDEAHTGSQDAFVKAVRDSGLNPLAFGLLKIPGDYGVCVTSCAQTLGIPCFNLDEKIFSDPYAVARTVRNIISATPVRTGPVVGKTPPRVSLVEKILQTELLSRPVWASPA